MLFGLLEVIVCYSGMEERRRKLYEWLANGPATALSAAQRDAAVQVVEKVFRHIDLHTPKEAWQRLFNAFNSHETDNLLYAVRAIVHARVVSNAAVYAARVEGDFNIFCDSLLYAQ